MTEQTGGAQDAFRFEATWRDYLPIALSNLALTIVTLGVYRFWAKARERRFLWSRTCFIDDRLEWTGTGFEMFRGFLIVALLLALPLLFIQIGFQAMVLRGYRVTAGLLMLLVYAFLLFFFGFAKFRALRYRLSRSWWHGIRGGSDEPGYSYGVAASWKPVVGWLAAGLLVPWSMTSLWNQRWGAMRYGNEAFVAEARAGVLMLRWLVLLISPIVIVIVVTVVGVGLALALGLNIASWSQGGGERAIVAVVLTALGFVFLIYALIGLIGIGFYAAFFREGVGKLRLGTLAFEFDARSRQWLLRSSATSR